MRRGKGFTLIELIIVAAVLTLLAGILVPALGSARDKARLAACAGNMRQVSIALASYPAANRNCLPPFAFSDFGADLPASGHWGGDPPGAPGSIGRGAISNVNLWALVYERMLSPQHAICPGAPAAVEEGSASYFSGTPQFSTYCLRFPYSLSLIHI